MPCATMAADPVRRRECAHVTGRTTHRLGDHDVARPTLPLMTHSRLRHLLTALVLGAGMCASVSSATAVIGGVPALPGQFPSLVALVQPDQDNYEGQFCAGTLVTPTRVLTAAHCVTTTNKQGALVAVPPARFQVLVGTENLANGTGRRIGVTAVTPNPLFLSPRRVGPDLALVTLAEPVSDITPARVAGPREWRAWSPASKGVAVGWGATNTDIDGEKTRFPAATMTTAVPFLPTATCRMLIGDMQGGGTLCMGGRKARVDACNGDSGGPVFGRDSLGAPIVVAVVSRGDGCATLFRPGVYAATAPMAHWLAGEGIPVSVAPAVLWRGPRVTLANRTVRSGETFSLSWRVTTGRPAAADVVIKAGGPRGMTIEWRQARMSARALQRVGVPRIDITRARETFQWCVVAYSATGAQSPARCARLHVIAAPSSLSAS